jgi:hypothetical protein
LSREQHTVPPIRSTRSSAAGCTESTNERIRQYISTTDARVANCCGGQSRCAQGEGALACPLPSSRSLKVETSKT